MRNSAAIRPRFLQPLINLGNYASRRGMLVAPIKSRNFAERTNREGRSSDNDNEIKIVLVFVVLILLNPGTILAQSTALIDAAKKEGGKVVAYGSLESDTVAAIKQAFQKSTGLELEYWRASATKVIDRSSQRISSR